jgi:hypothetical protein
VLETVIGVTVGAVRAPGLRPHAVNAIAVALSKSHGRDDWRPDASTRAKVSEFMTGTMKGAIAKCDHARSYT